MKKLSYLFLLLFVFGCQNKDSETPVPEISIEVQKKVSEFNDSTFVGITEDIQYSKGSIFLTEIENGRVLELNETYELKQIFGRKGDGPTELQDPRASQVHNNQLLILDGGHQKIKVFNLDGTISHQFGRDIPSNGGFFIKNNKLYGSKYDKSTPPLFSYSLTDENSIHYFGSHNRRLTEINHDRPRVFRLFPYKNEIIAVSENEPVIERFDFAGNKTEEIYYPEYFEEFIEHSIKREKSSPQMRGTAGFVIDASLHGSELYILLVGFDSTKNKVTSRQIFNFTISDSKIELSRIIELNNGKDDTWYMSFTIVRNKILAFDGVTYELHEFDLPKKD
tara:strand:- start:280 stop:1287 length:1008 start_codon:yes stop_codon:yes gene_type:complete